MLLLLLPPSWIHWVNKTNSIEHCRNFTIFGDWRRSASVTNDQQCTRLINLLHTCDAWWSLDVSVVSLSIFQRIFGRNFKECSSEIFLSVFSLSPNHYECRRWSNCWSTLRLYLWIMNAPLALERTLVNNRQSPKNQTIAFALQPHGSLL